MHEQRRSDKLGDLRRSQGVERRRKPLWSHCRGWRRRRTLTISPPTFVQAGPMDPWALMQKALLDALVLQEKALFQAEHAHAAQDQCPPGA